MLVHGSHRPLLHVLLRGASSPHVCCAPKHLQPCVLRGAMHPRSMSARTALAGACLYMSLRSAMHSHSMTAHTARLAASQLPTACKQHRGRTNALPPAGDHQGLTCLHIRCGMTLHDCTHAAHNNTRLQTCCKPHYKPKLHTTLQACTHAATTMRAGAHAASRELTAAGPTHLPDHAASCSASSRMFNTLCSI